MTKRHRAGRGRFDADKFVFYLLIGLFILNAVVAGFTIREEMESSFGYDANEMEWQIQNRDYPQLVKQLNHNFGREYQSDSSNEQAELLADYYENAILRHAYQAAGQYGRAGQYEAQMSELMALMTDENVIARAKELQQKYL